MPTMHKVRVFTSPSCAYCVTLKAFLETNNIEFEELDVAENARAREEMIDKSSQMGVPVIEIDGNIVIGFDREKITQLLNIKD